MILHAGVITAFPHLESLTICIFKPGQLFAFIIVPTLLIGVYLNFSLSGLERSAY